jgi:Ca2+-binding RTX toxin-like protein
MPNTTSVVPSGDSYIDPLLYGTKWVLSPLWFSFTDQSSDYEAVYYNNYPTNGYAAFNALQQAAVRSILGQVAAFTTLTFVEKSGAENHLGNLRFARSSGAATAAGFYPDESYEAGDVWVGYNSAHNTPTVGTYGFHTLIHEIGHALGLKHGHDAPALPSEVDTGEYTAMTYRSYVGAPLTGYTNETFGYSQTFMTLDVAALQYLYGANYGTNSGDTTYSWNPTTGAYSINGAVQWTPGGNRIYMTVWDGNGTDTYDFSAYTDPLAISLLPGGYSALSAAQRAYLGNGNFARGHVWNAFLHDGDTRSLIENAIGGSGNDLMYGNDAANVLDGRGGADSMLGGLGDDIYYVDNVGDLAGEGAGEGLDQVRVTLASYTLPTSIEGLVYWGSSTANFTGTGNSEANFILGWNGNDVLNGAGGADLMTGQLGNDIYFVDSLADSVIELNGEGVDEVRTAVGNKTNAGIYMLPAFVENFVGTSAAAQGAWLNGLDNVAMMGPGNDLVVLHDGGLDQVDGGAGNDFLYWGATFTTADTAVGGTGNDTCGLLGSYTLVLDADCLIGIERLAMYSAGNAPGAIPNIYNITTVDANVAAGVSLVVIALSLRGVETLTFNGAAETNGSFNVRGGRSGDIITTGAGSDQINGFLGADQLRGGGGNDYFEYYDATHSTAAAMDSILDFTAGDRINLIAIDADGNAANGNSAFSFIGASAFTHVAGQLRAYQSAGGGWFVEGDVNGDGAADLVISVTVTDLHALGAADFLL